MNIKEISSKKLSKEFSITVPYYEIDNSINNKISDMIPTLTLPGFIKGENRREVEERALELLKLLNIKNRKDHKPNELSGGEQQRVAVARALINNPSIILADEPSGNLDSKNAEELHNLLLKLNKEMGQTIVVVTHNDELANITHKKLEIKDGVIKK